MYEPLRGGGPRWKGGATRNWAFRKEQWSTEKHYWKNHLPQKQMDQWFSPIASNYSKETRQLT